MPIQARIAGLDLSIGGPPHACHISTLSVSLLASTVATYPSYGRADTAKPPGYRINSLTKVIGSGASAWSRASRALETGDALDLPWTRIWRRGHGSKWRNGDIVVVAARVLPLIWTANVNRVVAVTRTRSSVAVAWGTTHRHVLRGEEIVSVRRERNGDVIFHLRSFSRPHGFMAWIGYPFVVYLQNTFARGVSRRLVNIASELDKEGE
eukprot:GFKZ01000327.1.p1 GENE.GFKZ01000327.1~~GFKZ01000327.1.p1  ORF type:complete len:209 (+),score=4.87 GFKZ01000327.1:206-832(+)